MDGITVKLTAAQVATLLELLKPYAELSISLSNQYKMQTAQPQMPARAKKVKDQIAEDNNGNN